eukprot:406570_1
MSNDRDFAPAVLRKHRPSGGRGPNSGGNRGDKTAVISDFSGGQKKGNEGKNFWKVDQETENFHTDGVSKNFWKVDQETENFHTDGVSKNFSKALMQARLAKKMKQKELAQKCNMKESDIRDLETGKGKPNQQHVQKVARVLGVKLPKARKKRDKYNIDDVKQ